MGVWHRGYSGGGGIGDIAGVWHKEYNGGVA